MPLLRQPPIAPFLSLRAEIIAAIRSFFASEAYLEVETPVLIPAPAPECHIDAVRAENGYLQTSPELCMKRLMAGGYPRIYQICKCFRAKERGRRHLPELTLLEWYTEGGDYKDMMAQCERLIESLRQRTGADSRLSYQGMRIELTPPWDRITVEEAFNRFAAISMDEALKDGTFDECMGIEIEPNLGIEKPVFLYDYPVAMGALARRNPANPALAERFELYMGGLELCNAFSELTDANEQRRRFESERHRREKLGKPVYPMPEKFLADLEKMPACTGNAMGVDRLVMLFADTADIDDVVAFVPESL